MCRTEQYVSSFLTPVAAVQRDTVSLQPWDPLQVVCGNHQRYEWQWGRELHWCTASLHLQRNGVLHRSKAVIPRALVHVWTPVRITTRTDIFPTHSHAARLRRDYLQHVISAVEKFCRFKKIRHYVFFSLEHIYCSIVKLCELTQVV